jgi:hypothetical protein
MRKAIRVLGILAAFGVVWVGARAAARWTVKAASVERRPLTIQFREIRYGVPPNPQDQEEVFTWAIRGNGSTVEVRDRIARDGTPFRLRRIVDLDEGKEVLVNGLIEAVTTYFLSERAVEFRRQIPSCSLLEQANPTVFGFKTHGYVARQTCDPSGTRCEEDRSVESQYVPELGCALVRRTVFDGASQAQPQPRLTQEPLSITIGEPDPALFQTPDWPEKSPAKVADELRQRLGAEIRSRSWEIREDAYWAQRSRGR